MEVSSSMQALLHTFSCNDGQICCFRKKSSTSGS
ncbi:hypothetical protein FOQG_19491 [Fusarium oxysporum f. sp. raphani 54005]|uniref:Uncharacterized protein n=1 Tax=Fusarium oxysporum f. sp. raphani 54005 TaxID=1089458 RepID=X0BBA0_FUSOX|nr:hypothetical protein FOQG_19491 [Fusarium oxysporum f. sp. raphani 54005]